jgi:ABC-2 type transport system permease protein
MTTINTTTATGGEARGGFSAPRTAPNQWNAFGGIWRLTAWRFLSRNQLLVTAGLLVVLAFFCSKLTAPRSPEDYLDWVAGFLLSVVVPVLAFLSGAGVMRDETKPGSVDYVFTRPVRRWAFVGFKYLAHTACLQAMWLLAFGVVVFFAAARNAPDVAGTYVWVLLAQMLTIAAFVAFGFFCAVVTSRYLVIGIVYAGVVEGGIGSIDAPLSRLSMTRQIRELLEPKLLAVSDGISALDALTTMGAMLLFASVFVGLAAVIFSMREMTGAPAKE